MEIRQIQDCKNIKIDLELVDITKKKKNYKNNLLKFKFADL